MGFLRTQRTTAGHVLHSLSLRAAIGNKLNPLVVNTCLSCPMCHQTKLETTAHDNRAPIVPKVPLSFPDGFQTLRRFAFAIASNSASCPPPLPTVSIPTPTPKLLTLRGKAGLQASAFLSPLFGSPAIYSRTCLRRCVAINFEKVVVRGNEV